MVGSQAVESGGNVWESAGKELGSREKVYRKVGWVRVDGRVSDEKVGRLYEEVAGVEKSECEGGVDGAKQESEEEC